MSFIFCFWIVVWDLRFHSIIIESNKSIITMILNLKTQWTEWVKLRRSGFNPQVVILLPCQWKYWHRAKNRLPDKTGFVMYNPQNVEKSGFGQSVCVSVCPSVCLSGRLSVLLSLFPRALTGVRFNRSSWNFRGMFSSMGHCAVPIIEAIREPVHKII